MPTVLSESPNRWFKKQRLPRQLCHRGQRGSQYFLGCALRNDTLRFFLYAPREKKIDRLISQGKTKADAETLADTVDDERGSFIKKYFHADWPNRSVYHAMLNTDSGDETVIQAILSFLHMDA